MDEVALSRVAEAHPIMDEFATAQLQPVEGESVRVRFNAVTPGYMEMLRIPLARGRTIHLQDGPGAPPVAVVNQAFVEQILPGTPGLGQQIRVTGWWDSESPEDRPETTLQVVGVVADRETVPGEANRPFFWTSFLQERPFRAIIHVKGRQGAESLVPVLRREIPVLPNELTLIDPSPYADLVSYRFLGHRMASRALTFAGLFALILAFIGVYGIVSFAVSQRFREMAIRQAMGARKDQVVRSILGHGLKTAGVGVTVGLLVAVPGAFLARSGLLGVPPLDAWAVGGGTGVLLLAALVAGLIPARRLLSAEPMEVLRED